MILLSDNFTSDLPQSLDQGGALQEANAANQGNLSYPLHRDTISQ